MNRRKFLLSSGAAVLTGTSLTAINQKPSLGVSFTISGTETNKNLSNINSIQVSFETLKITPQHLSENEDLNVKAKLQVGSSDPKIKETTVSSSKLNNGKNYQLSSDIGYMLIDGLQLSGQNYVTGSVIINVDHPDISKRYKKTFNISNSETKLIDSFEDQDLSEYFGATDRSSISSNQVLDGSYSLAKSTGGLGGYLINSTSGLNYYPEQGDTIYVHFYAGDSSDTVYFNFGYQDSKNYYRAAMRSDKWGPKLYKSENDSKKDITPIGNSSMPTNQWVQMRIDWNNNGTIRYRVTNASGTVIYDETGTDNSFTSGGIGFGHDNSSARATTIYFDRVFSE
jgi:hypothetical protein